MPRPGPCVPDDKCSQHDFYQSVNNIEMPTTPDRQNHDHGAWRAGHNIHPAVDSCGQGQRQKRHPTWNYHDRRSSQQKCLRDSKFCKCWPGFGPTAAPFRTINPGLPRQRNDPCRLSVSTNSWNRWPCLAPLIAASEKERRLMSPPFPVSDHSQLTTKQCFQAALP